jgi:hypothetical protein
MLINLEATPKILKKYMKWGARRATILKPSLGRTFMTGKALILYYSKTGNTKKVAFAIEKGIRKGGLQPTVKRISEALNENYYDYDLICFGSPTRHAFPPKEVINFIHKHFLKFRRSPREVQLPSLPIPGKYALIFVTFSGPHIGVKEAFPVGKFLVQDFMHLGFKIVGEWYIVGEFHRWKDGSTKGSLGDIRGRPNQEDLTQIEEKIKRIIENLDCNNKNQVIWTNIKNL